MAQKTASYLLKQLHEASYILISIFFPDNISH